MSVILTESGHRNRMRRMPKDDSVSMTPKYLIGAVTRMTGLSIDVVRVWERRYGAVRPSRSEGGTRIYSDADVRRLTRLRQAVEKGFGIGQAVRLTEDELDELIEEKPQSPRVDPYSELRGRFIDAVQTMDVGAAEQELSRAATLFSTAELVKNVVAPALGEAAERADRGSLGAAEIHLATSLLRGLLWSLLRLYPAPAEAETIVLAAPSPERDDFDLLACALLAAANGWRVVYLGADLAASEIGRSVGVSKAKMLVLNAAADHSRLGDEIRVISNLVPASVRVCIRGQGAVRHKALIERANWTLTRGLDEVDELLRK